MCSAFNLQGQTGLTNIFEAGMMVSRKETIQSGRLRHNTGNFDIRS